MKWLAPALVALALCPTLAGCNQLPGRPLVETLETREWRQVATANDRERIGNWRATFIAARADAIEGGHRAEIEALGALGQPDSAIPYSPPPPGMYRCRTIKIGAKGEHGLHYVDYPWFSCRIRIEDDLQSLAKLTGSQRQVGLLMPDDQFREIFLGTLVLGDEDRAMRYSADPDRDVAGLLQRIDERHWRLVLPEPRYESLTDIIELVPAE